MRDFLKPMGLLGGHGFPPSTSLEDLLKATTGKSIAEWIDEELKNA